MQRKPVESYVRLGALIQFLIHADEGLHVFGEASAIHAIRDLMESFDSAQLAVSIRASWKIGKLLKGLEKRPAGSVLSAADVDEVRGTMIALRETVNAEVEGIELFAATPKRIDLAKLMHEPAALLAKGVFDRLPELTRYDLREAALCLAYDRPTAAAFHLLRAAENSLRDFYCLHVRRGRITSMMWGPILNDFAAHPTVLKRLREPTALLAQLDYIRKQFRNPTQHPEKVYDIEEAQDLWGLCVDVITRMAPPATK